MNQLIKEYELKIQIQDKQKLKYIEQIEMILRQK